MFRTEVQVKPTNLHLTHQHKALTIGSCFAEVIGRKLLQHKADVLVNPFGTIFNPISLCLLLKAAATQVYTFDEHLVEHNGIWYAYDFHSSLSSPSKTQLLGQIHERLDQTRQQLEKAEIVIITLGTAVAYKLKDTGKVVANCHKLPAKQFDRFILSTSEIEVAFQELLPILQSINPKLKVILTVSPVRHVKETLETNSVSKAILCVVCHQLTQQYANILYFPAYEIMLDDLRDYRFYKQDMLHPTEVAEDYIWEKFLNAYYSSDFREFTLEWSKIQRALQHRSFHPQSEAHQSFLKNTLQQLETVGTKYKLDLSAEKQLILNQLA
ncbi:GSCFA domain-containing protein [Pontibacter arcticus]|uniref:GSCFA domain-containing protein n=1 Tax=Pontibacter arcticus TaxID=2080288 RepID=A0A364RGY0_9BACT|nr:GSCFA domain-containing protein [Pontibacter arcticus]RAU83542.1 hypothetical protein DP923_00200 [Pontibacter arcticus]